MRTSSELEAMLEHPAGSAPVASGSGATEERGDREPTVYDIHFDALDRLNEEISAHGPASIEARVARARVDRTRELAVSTWDRRSAA